MTTTIVALVLISAAMHPLREYFIKSDATPEGVTLAVVFQFGVFAGIHAWVLGVDPWISFKVWPFMVVSGFGLLFYYWSVVTTLRTGDLSIYYPITRSSPIFVVIFGYLILGETYSLTMLLGIALVLIGAFLLQYKPGTRLLSQPLTLWFAVLAMYGHGVITLADAAAVRQVEPMAFLFCMYLFVIPAMTLMFVVTRPAGRTVYGHLFVGWVQSPFRFLIAGSTAYASYYLILTSFQLGANVAAVSAIRQVSIPLSVLMGGLVLKETRMNSRLGWSLMLAVGVVVIILAD
ncbi:MAG: DMT family transporter [Hyphomicrobiales bacterium]|nr:DMT family transporter [Hyphomicrobiales bacterium]